MCSLNRHLHLYRSKITDTDRAVLQLKTQRRQLTGQRKRVRIRSKLASWCLRMVSCILLLVPSSVVAVLTGFLRVAASSVLCQQVEDLIARELAIARELIAAKRRERALLALKKKKLREGQLEQIDAYLLNVEQVNTIQQSALRPPWNFQKQHEILC